MGQAQFLNESEDAIRFLKVIFFLLPIHVVATPLSSLLLHSRFFFLFRLIFLPRPLLHRHPLCPKRPPWATTKNTICLRLVMVASQETATGFRHDVVMAYFQQHWSLQLKLWKQEWSLDLETCYLSIWSSELV